MPKLKTQKSAAKRFKKTASGKIKHKRAFASHILTKKTSKRKRHLRKSALISGRDQKRVRRLVPFL